MPLGATGHLPGMERLMDLAYRAVADNRGGISRVLGLDSCGARLRRTGPG